MDSNTDSEKELQQDSKDGFSKEYLEKVAVMQAFLPSASIGLYRRNESPFFIYKDALYFQYKWWQSQDREDSWKPGTGKLHKYTFINNKLVKYSFVGVDVDYLIAGLLFVTAIFIAISSYLIKGYTNMAAIMMLFLAFFLFAETHLSHLWAKKKMEAVWNSRRNVIPVKESLS